MPQDNPKVQVRTETPFGVHYQELNTDHNQNWNTVHDWRYSILNRLAFPARLEEAIADALLWISTSAMVGSLAVYSIYLGVPVAVIVWLSVFILFPILLWANWINSNLEDGFKQITGLRLSLVLFGIAISVLFLFI